MKTKAVFSVLTVTVLTGCASISSFRIPHAQSDLQPVKQSEIAVREISAGWAALRQSNYVEAATHYSKAVAAGASGRNLDPNSTPRDPDDAEYCAARCYSLIGDRKMAFKYLMLSLGTAPIGDLRRDPDFLNRDPDFSWLHQSPEWKRMIGKLSAERSEYLKSTHPKLYELFIGDQADLIFRDWSKPGKENAIRRRERRLELDKILERGELSQPDDFYFAALLLAHSPKGSSDYLEAGKLAREGVSRGTKIRHARWLVASSQDQYLLSVKKPQWYGTRVKRDENRRWVLEPVDGEAVTDAERQKWNVPALEERKKQVEAWNAQ